MSISDASLTTHHQLLLGNKESSSSMEVWCSPSSGEKRKQKKTQQPKELPPHCMPTLYTYIGKVFTSLLKQRCMDNIHESKWLPEHCVQKAFVDCMPGCTEHHIKLFAMLHEAHAEKAQTIKSLCACVLARLRQCFWQCSPHVDTLLF